MSRKPWWLSLLLAFLPDRAYKRLPHIARQWIEDRCDLSERGRRFMREASGAPTQTATPRERRQEASMNTRQGLLDRAAAIRREIEQIFLDAEHWNRINPDQEPIDPDPDGELRKVLAGLPGDEPAGLPQGEG